ncbi:hypothetical protein LJC32_02015 [Oscillospiraceae bacterium OttesenSCG-928-F05]|nr:hypothetical protein [Oscillospiraceae bacterium OttesenSCG-928-F05]
MNNSDDMHFVPGRLLMTSGVSKSVPDIVVAFALHSHLGCNWGDIGIGDWKQNDMALITGDRLLSRYNTPYGDIFIITEADRSATTVLLTGEY